MKKHLPIDELVAEYESSYHILQTLETNREVMGVLK